MYTIKARGHFQPKSWKINAFRLVCGRGRELSRPHPLSILALAAGPFGGPSLTQAPPFLYGASFHP